jgi:sugar transferase (PEP-CTERM/EpsH1 system associated)
MNILFLTKEVPFPPDNGHRNRSFHMLEGLAKKHSISLICFGNSQTDENRIEGIKQYCDSITIIPAKKQQNRLSFLFLAFSGILSFLPNAIKSRYSPEMKEKVEKLLQNDKIECVLCDSIYQAVHLSKQKRAKTILAEHNIESLIIYRYFLIERNLFKKLYAFLEWVKFRSFENKTWPIFDKCMVVSDPEKEEISKRTVQRNIEIIPNGVDTNYFNFNNVKEKPLSLIYTGQMDWHPNIDAMDYFLRKIFPLIKAQIPDISFCILGHKPPKKIQILAERSHSIITGFVDDVRSYVAEASVFVVPLRIGSGTRLKILEAMSMGKPIVSTSIGCEGLEVTNGENIVIADEPALFANQVIKLLQDPVLRKKLGSAARRTVEEKYTWDKITEKLNMVV